MKEIRLNDIKSLAHTQWNCKYHIVFEISPKYAVASVMGFLKGKSSLIIYQKWAQMTLEDFDPFMGSK